MEPLKNILNKAKTTMADPFSTQEQGRPQHIYSYISDDIKQSMADKYYPSKMAAKFYKNNIFHSTNKYEVPVQDPLKKVNTENSYYNDFYRSHRKFTKPYGEITKYVDTISRNKQILRRAQCDTPISVNVQKKTIYDGNSKKKFRYFKRTARTTDFQANIANQTKSSILFDKTIKSQYQVFRNLISRQRKNTNQRKFLNNSLNRLLASESIYEKVNDLLSVNSKGAKNQL